MSLRHMFGGINFQIWVLLGPVQFLHAKNLEETLGDIYDTMLFAEV